MADVSAVQAAVESFGHARYEEGFNSGVASRQAEVDGLKAEVTELEHALAAATAPKPETPPLPTPTPTVPPQPTGTRPAYGISTHTNFRNSPVYSNDAKTLEVTIKARPTYMRDLLSLYPGRDALWRKYVAAGVKGWHVTVGQYGETDANKPKIAAELLKSADIIHEATGWNEPDGEKRPISEWLPKVVAWQKWLWTTVKGNPKTAHIKVGLGALRGANKNGAAETKQLMDACKGFFEFVDLHVYPGPTRDPKAVLDEHIKWAGGAKVVISEYGGSMANMTAQQQATVIATGIKYLATKGIVGYVYELWDDPDPTGADLQSNFGIFESDGTAKPAVAALTALRL